MKKDKKKINLKKSSELKESQDNINKSKSRGRKKIKNDQSNEKPKNAKNKRESDHSNSNISNNKNHKTNSFNSRSKSPTVKNFENLKSEIKKKLNSPDKANISDDNVEKNKLNFFNVLKNMTTNMLLEVKNKGEMINCMVEADVIPELEGILGQDHFKTARVKRDFMDLGEKPDVRKVNHSNDKSEYDYNNISNISGYKTKKKLNVENYFSDCESQGKYNLKIKKIDKIKNNIQNSEIKSIKIDIDSNRFQKYKSSNKDSFNTKEIQYIQTIKKEKDNILSHATSDVSHTNKLNENNQQYSNDNIENQNKFDYDSTKDKSNTNKKILEKNENKKINKNPGITLENSNDKTNYINPNEKISVKNKAEEIEKKTKENLIKENIIQEKNTENYKNNKNKNQENCKCACLVF